MTAPMQEGRQAGTDRRRSRVTAAISAVQREGTPLTDLLTPQPRTPREAVVPVVRGTGAAQGWAPTAGFTSTRA